MKYELKARRVHWTCGDNCCSDSWEELQLYQGDKCLLDTEVYSGLNSEYDSDQELLDYVNEAFKEYKEDVLTLQNCDVTCSVHYTH